MIGLVNALGVPEAGRALQAKHRSEQSLVTQGNLAPVLNAELAANKVLRSAVEAIEFQAGRGPRAETSDAEPSRFDELQRPPSAEGPLGRFLDAVG